MNSKFDIDLITKKNNTSIRRLLNELKQYNPIWTSEYNCSYVFKGLNIDLYFNKSYPFKPPTKILINNRILSYINIPYRLWNYYTNILNYGCPCCSSIICSEKWLPGNKIEEIINEYIDFKNKLINIRNITHFIDALNILNKLPFDIQRNIISFII